MLRTSPTVGMTLHTVRGRRKYLTPGERMRFLEAASTEPPEIGTLCLTLAWTGCRVSEALGLTHADIDHDGRIVTVRCLKKRRSGLVREVPVPAKLLTALARVHGAGAPDAQLWPMARSTAWRHVKRVMRAAGVGASAASPKGLRHGFGVHAVRSGVPLNLLQRWLGHASMATTAIYADVMGAEEQEIAARMW
ncbi:tyrosine-type recombinase/integrase [Methylobacterium sp. Leaf123]|uniref:tyrosine-type recombinase/integrase n=1 Tax=Methylobacterium sp. Leaf123 TaxID=1736264 RepID=UPI000AB134C3|nr:tyrosine-type recombinase/integrase [Methylobacterium sp. Leaf123]